MLSRVFLHGCVLAEILQNATFYLGHETKIKNERIEKNETIKKKSKENITNNSQ